MKFTVALDNLNYLFKENDSGETETEVNTECTIYRENGKITEIRIWNQEYEEFIVIERTGKVQAISVDEYRNK